MNREKRSKNKTGLVGRGGAIEKGRSITTCTERRHLKRSGK